MRSSLIALIILFVFTTAQVAVAYDRCDDADCSISMSDQKQEKKQQKADACAHHCSGVQAMHEVRHVLEPLAVEAVAAKWPDTQQLASATTATLLEPPSIL